MKHNLATLNMTKATALEKAISKKTVSQDLN